MPAMEKSEVIESLEMIQRNINTDAMAVLALIKAVKDIDGELDGETSSGLRYKLNALECDVLYDAKGGVSRLEAKMYNAEDRCYWCGDRIENEDDGFHDGDGKSHISCGKRHGRI